MSWEQDDRFNAAIDEAIVHLCDDDPNQGAGALLEIAQMWAKAGLPQSSFTEVRQHIVNEAKARTDALFIDEKLLNAERLLQEQRNGSRIITNIVCH